jgi:hypothetical protein
MMATAQLSLAITLAVFFACTNPGNEAPPSYNVEDPSAPGTDHSGQWLDTDGNFVSTRIINSGPGPEHCDWQSATYLHLAIPLGVPAQSGVDSIQFIKDPLKVMVDIYDGDTVNFLANTVLPGDAYFSGYTKNGIELWISDSELEDGIYLVEGNHVEKWPRIDPKILCA